MGATLHGGIGLYDDGRAVRFYVNIDGTVHTCLIGEAILNRLTGIDGTGEALFDQFMDNEDLIVARAAVAITRGAKGDPLILPSDLFH